MTPRLPAPTPDAELPTLADALAAVDSWEVPHVAAAAAGGAGAAAHGPTDRRFAIASVTKLLTAWAVLVGVEEGAVGLDDPVGPPGATLAHLLGHAGGWGFEGDAVLAPPGTRRIYSNHGYEAAASHLVAATGIPFADYLAEGVLGPLGMTATELRDSPARGAWSTVADLSRFCAELARPTLLGPSTVERFRSPQFPGLAGVVPGWGRFEPCPWGCGPELRGTKTPHWMGSTAGAGCLGHFGASGTFLWLDPVAGIWCVVLGDRPFGQWAVARWPAFSDTVRAVCSIGHDG